MEYKIGLVYLATLGIVTLLFGGLDIVLAIMGRELLTDLLTASGSMWSLWKGLVLFFAGVFMLIGAINLKDVHGLGEAVLGSVMLWIVAGGNIFARITESVLGDQTWFSTFEKFLASYGPPYELELWLLPFSFVILYFISKSGR